MTEIIGVALLLFCLFIGMLAMLLMGYLREKQRADRLQQDMTDLREGKVRSKE